MTTPILCYECGEYLGSVFEFINTAKNGFYKTIFEKSSVNIDKIDLSGNTAQPIGFILDAAQIKNICCRKCLISYVDFTQYMK
jgi:DNA-directed RNA polymerase subunit N (RpoN/RPB10)